MMTIRSLIALAILAGLTGCAYEGPAGDGSAVRLALASQMLPPQPHADAGVDGAATIAAYTNYKQSYAQPTPQNDSGLIRK